MNYKISLQFLLLIPLLVSCKHETPKVKTSEDFTAHGVVFSYVPTQEDLDKLPLVERPFVYIKATDGVTSFSPVVDDNFHKYADVGFYHVFRVTDDITSQLDVYCKVLHDNYKNLKPMVAIDVKENIGVDVYRVFLHSFIDSLYVREHMRPMVYATNEDYNKYCGTEFDWFYEHLICRYDDVVPIIPGHEAYTIWQYAEKDGVGLCRYRYDKDWMDIGYYVEYDYSKAELEMMLEELNAQEQELQNKEL